MPGTATLSDIVDEQKPGVASLADIDESTPEERATVSKAIASVPYHPPKMEWSSVAPIPEVESEKTEPYSLKKAVVGGLTDILTHPEPGAETGITPLGPEAVKGTEELGTKGQRWRGAARLASTGLQAAAPVLAPTAGLEAPVSTAIGLGTGYGASKVAGKVSEKLGAEPETKQVVEDLAFWAPTVAGMLSGASGTAVETPEAKGAGVTAFGDRVRAGVAVTPEQVSVAGKVGPFSGRVNIPRNGKPAAPAIEPQTIEGQHANAPTDPDVALAVAAQRENLQATRMASGLPPVEPPVPAPPPPPAPQIGMDQVAKMGEAISKLPPDLRAQAMVEAHGKLAQVFLQMGKVVNPHDGKLTVITKPEQADKLASDFINGEVERRDKLAEEARKQAEGAQEKSVRKTSGVVENPVEAADKFEITPPAGVGLAHVSDIETANEQPSGLPAGERDIAVRAQSNEPGRQGEPARSPSGSGNLPVNAGTGENPERTGEVPRFVKGDRVTLNDGSEATIHYSSPGMRLVRLVTEDGRRMTVSGKDVNKLQRVPTNVPEGAPMSANVTAESAPMATNVPNEVIGEKIAKPRTEGEPLEHGFNTQPAEDLGQAVREATQKTEGALPRGERRKIERTPEEQQTQELFGQARKELGEDASSDQVMARVGELKKSALPAEEKKFKHRSTQVNIPEESEASQAIEAARSRISKEDLAGDGKDIGGNHVTVRWGLQAADDADLSKLKSYISSLAPFEASLGKTSKFKPSESSDGAAVIQAPIEAPELHKINDEISKHGDFTEPTFKYSPHATVAYVKPEKADRYTGMEVTHGKKFTVKSISISDRNGGQEEVPLKGSSNLTEAPAKSEPKPEKSVGPAPGEVGRMKVSDLKLAPARFQYKLGTDAEGVSSLLKDTTKFNPNLANTISVWKDPEDEKFYVVNGHHRYELAKRTGQKEIDVRHIQASDATHARAIGAMQNIAEGRGTAVDAAKFFRDSGIKIEDLEKEGISLGEATAKNGLALSRLDQPIFNKVVSGDLRVGRGVAIGEATSDAAEQKAILNLVERREARGQKISDGQLSELVRFVKEAGKEQETTADLFGSQQITKSLALEKAEVSDYIKTQLAKDRKLFGFVAKEGRAGELARGENVINVEKSKEISTGAQQAEEVYNRLSSRGGDIASILDEAAGKISESDSERSRSEIKRQAYERVRDAVSRTLGGGQEGSPQRSEATPETKEAAGKPGGERESAVSLFSNDPERPAPTFYSKAARVAFEKVSNNAPGSSILATLKNNGVKPEEIKWLGLDDFLAGKFRVQKKDLMSHILHNLMQVSEVSKGQRTPEQQQAIDEAKDKFNNAYRSFQDLLQKDILDKWGTSREGIEQSWDEGKAQRRAQIIAQEVTTSGQSSAEILYAEYEHYAYGKKPSDELLRAGANLFNANQDVKASRKDNQLPTKYEQYTLPGPKENYTELLLTLPESNAETTGPSTEVVAKHKDAWDAITRRLDYLRGEWETLNVQPIPEPPAGQRTPTRELLRMQRNAELEKIEDQVHSYQKDRDRLHAQMVSETIAAKPKAAQIGRFTTSHFDEPNILTHVRFDDRTDADGKKVLFVEEVQSDWHQKGKKQGYKGDLERALTPEEKELQVLNHKTWTAPPNQDPWTDAERARAQELQAKVGVSLADKARRLQSDIPDAPFKTDWHELAMKRMLRYAAEHGYERLGWVTGQQTADRYNLAKYVDKIEAFRKKDGSVDLMVMTKDQPGHRDFSNIAPDKLSDTVGKDLAEKILHQPQEGTGLGDEGWHTYSGLDLKVGGEWAKRLYDQAIPNFLNKVGKKLGAKVGETELATGTENDRIFVGTQPSQAQIREVHRTSHGTLHTAVNNVISEMQDGRSFNQAMDSFGSEELAEKFGGKMQYRLRTDTVHSIDITPEMAYSVVYEGQPLFQNDPYALIRDRAPEAWAHIASKATASPVQQSGLRPYVEMNSEGLQLVARAIRRPFLGASIPPKNVPEIFAGFDDIFKKIKKTSPEAAANLEQIKQAIKGAVDKDSGVTIAPKRDLFNSQHDLRILHEELFHAEVQHGPGRGVLARGVPAEMINDPGIRQMVMRIENETGRSEESLPEVIIAEAMADIVTGTPHELKPELAEQTATKYYEAVGEMHGVGTLEKAQAIQDLVDEKARTLGLTKEGEGFHEKYNQPARTALRTVLEKYRAKDGAGRQQAGTGEVARREGERAPGSPPPGNESLNALPGKGAGSGELGAAGALASTAPVGLTDEELAEWSKSKGFRSEPVGEQLGMFGQNEPVHRVYRLGGKGKEQVGLAYQSQLDKLNQPKAEPTEPFALTGDEAPRDDQPRLFGAGDMGEIIGTPQQKGSLRRDEEESTGSLFNSDKGTFEPAKVSEAIRKAKGPLGEYLRSEVINNKIARRLHSGMYDLESQYSADVLRAVHTMTATLKEAGPKAKEIFAGIYHHMENPEGHPLTAEQDKFFDDVILPISEDTDVKFTRLEELLGKADANLIENYVHRVVKGKGSFFDRILQGVKGTGRGNLLTKTSPQTKHRTMMALERNDGIYQKRMVISIKGGQVTAWENGHPENLGGISHTDEGKVWQDKDGGLWTLRQATTQEIEKHTDLRYYHNALASVMVSNLQVRKALRGAEFINTFKASPEFKDIAMKVGTGTPPNQWRMTQLPQMRDYYFEPHTAEVLDWYANRIKGQDPNIFDKLNSFLRTSIFFNPLIHIPNISVHWLAEKGPSGYIPTTGGRETYQSSVRAINAVIHQNQDFLKLLDAGAPMQSQREDTAKLTKLFFDQLSEGLEKNEDWALKLAKTVGMSPVNLTKALYRFSGRATWVTNDIAFAQAVFAKMDSGMDMKAAIEQTAKHIPDYRLPVRMLNSAGLSKILSNNAITMFMAYHYGALKSYAEMAKSAVGASEPPPGRSKAGEAAHGWELLAGVGLITFILYPLIADEVAKKITGDKNARFRRAGAATFPYNAYMLATHQKSASDVLQSVVTPAVGTKTAGELVTNRDFYTGRKIYDPLDSWQDEAQQVGRKLLESVSPVGQGSRVWEGGERRKRALYGMVGISFPKTRAEKVASDIALEKIGTAPQDEAKMESYQERHAVLDALRKGDSGPLNDARDKGDLSPAQVKKLRHRASLTPLQDTVNNFTYLETMKVMEAAKADGNQEQVEDLERVLARKRRNMWARHEQVPAEVE